MKEKSNLVDTMLGLIKNLKNKYNLQVQYLHCNNPGENIAFKKACKQEGLGVDFDTASGTPQQKWLHQKKICYPFQQDMCHSQWL